MDMIGLLAILKVHDNVMEYLLSIFPKGFCLLPNNTETFVTPHSNHFMFAFLSYDVASHVQPIAFYIPRLFISSHLSGKCFNGCALKRRRLFGVWNVGVCGCGWGVHTFTKLSQHVNMENNFAPMCVNVVPHGVEVVLMWQWVIG